MKTRNESRLTRLRNHTAKDGGFTLIEVLAVMVIVGLLAAIAIPQIGKFRERAHVASMMSDARNLINEAEGVYTDTNTYPTSTPAVDLSPNNSVAWAAPSENGVNFVVSSSKTDKTVQVVNSRLAGASEAGSDAPLSAADQELMVSQCSGELNAFDRPVLWVGFDPEAYFFSAPRPCPGYEGTFTALYDGVGSIFDIEWHGPGAAPQPHAEFDDRTWALMNMAMAHTSG